MSEAQRLKMTGGHFIWIWADTSSTAEFFQPNSVPNIDDKDQAMNVKGSYEDFVERKQKYDKLETPSERQYYQQQVGNKRPQQNNTRYKSLNMNSNRFHHIIGLRKPTDDLANDGAVPSSILPERSFLKGNKFEKDLLTDQVPIRDKRTNQKFETTSDIGTKNAANIDSHPIPNDYTSSLENEKTFSNLNIKNINSHEFNANYYDPYSPRSREGESENEENNFGDDLYESTNEENGSYDYDKVNPFQHITDSISVPTTRRTLPDTSTTKHMQKPKANNDIKNADDSNRNNRNNVDNNKIPTPLDQITALPDSKFFDGDDDLESYSGTSNDLKAKRADNFPPSFNVTSHVFFHHFKDFPVGLLALRHIKMNVDRVFVRSAIRLFATTWSRVEQDEELRIASGGKLGGRKNNWQDNWSDNENDYDDLSNKNKKQQKNKTNVNVNSRNNNARGSRKYKRDTQGTAETTRTSIPNLVNSSNKTNNSNSKIINNLTNKTYSQHVSDLNSHTSDDVNKSNNDTIKNKVTTNSNKTKLNESATQLNVDREIVRELSIDGKLEVQKRQNSWWSSTSRGRNQEKVKTARGTPQYKGGCFGIPTRADLKRSELFAR